MKKVIYAITSLSHKRVFETFEPRKDIEQMILGPMPKISNIKMIVPEDYSDFKIKNIALYWNKKEMQEKIDEFKPDIYVEASLPVAHDLKLPSGCKKVYVSHGMVGNHVKGIIKKAGFNTSVWKGCDLYCGATKVFDEWIKHVAKVGDNRILLNALPQLDILYDSDYYDSYRDRVLARTRFPEAKKVILFIGFCCKDRFDFKPHNEDYFATAIELEKIARDNGWLVMVKPRQTYDAMIKFLRGHKWGKKYLQDYTRIQNSKHMHFITTTGHIYRYFFADTFVLNGTSTVEVEACAIQKPIFRVQTCIGQMIDPFGMIASGAAMSIPDLAELRHDLVQYFEHRKYHYPDCQKKHIADMGIAFDGQMHQRVQNKIAKM